MIIEMRCFKTFDGRLFEDEKQAKAHADDILGEELDGLLKMFHLDITRTQEYKALLALMKNRDGLQNTIARLHAILSYDHGDDEQ